MSTSLDPFFQAQFTNYTNYARDGTTILDDVSLLDFFVRSLLILCFYLCCQLPERLHVSIDRDQFLSAFHAKDTSGQPFSLTPWELGPDGPVAPSHPTNPETQSSPAVVDAADIAETESALQITSDPEMDAATESGANAQLSPRQAAFACHRECYEFLAPAIPFVPSTYPGFKGEYSCNVPSNLC